MKIKALQLDGRGKKCADVAGKVVEGIDCFLGEERDAHVYIRFADRTELDIKVPATPTVVGEWFRNKNGDRTPLPQRKIFE
jgi:hypothetical protein